MHFVVYGEDTYRSRKKLASLAERFSATRDASGLNVAVCRAGETTADAAAEAVFASPFLAEKKLVILKGFLQASKADQEKVGDALARQPGSTIVILYEDAGAGTLGKSALFAALAAEKFSEEFPPLTSAAAEKFVVDECAVAGAGIEPKASRLLVANVGVDAWQLHEEASKLAAYAAAVGARVVTEETVRGLAAGGREEPIFTFIDACAEGRSGDAVKLLERLLDAGVAELQIVAMLAKHYRSAIAAGDLAARGKGDGRLSWPDAQTVARTLGIHPLPAGKALAFARKRRPESLRAGYERLIEIERAFKSGGPRPKVTLALFAAKLGAP